METEHENAYLLTWNPKSWQWSELEQRVAATDDGQPVEEPWSCGRNRHVEPGSRVFLLRQGLEPKGIIGSGLTLTAPEFGKHWQPERAEQGHQALYVSVLFDRLLNPEMGDEPLPLSALRRGKLATVHWDTHASGIRIKTGVDELERLWEEHLRRVRPPEPEQGATALEGALRTALSRHRARETWLRAAKLQEVLSTGGRLACEVGGCGFDFFDVYGEIGRDFAHVHHKKPLADRTTPSETKLSDLAIVCANCHAMIHRGGECRAMETLLAKRP
jgi:5-methylcytosine-specific restriction enzyme A